MSNNDKVPELNKEVANFFNKNQKYAFACDAKNSSKYKTL